MFLPVDEDDAAKARRRIEELALEEGLAVLGWREVPVEPDCLGASARRAMPRMAQVVVVPSGTGTAPGTRRRGGDALVLDRLAFCLRKRVEHEVHGVYVPSLSARTLVYKGMLTGHQLGEFFPDLSDPSFDSGLALVHSRFSTNTFPSWPLAHPYRYLAHNGEINTLRGNRNWMRAREALLESDLIPGDLERLFPICDPDGSDSATFDEVLELLHLGGRSLPHAVLMMIPEAWENHTAMDPARRAFYRYHASLMEPWDGPAGVVFTDGTVAGGVLDRNGLRPARYWVTDDGLVVLASEVGVLDIDPAQVVRKGRLQPGRMFLVDTAQGRIVDDDEIKAQLAAVHPYGAVAGRGPGHVGGPAAPDDAHPPARVGRHPSGAVRLHQRGAPPHPGPDGQRSAAEGVGSMGHDAAIAALSERPRLIFDYFTQLFAQVTNPPLDAIREELVTSSRSKLGPEGNLLEPTAASCRQIILPYPVIDNDELAKLAYVNEHGETPGYQAFAIDGLFDPTGGGDALRAAIEDVRKRVSIAIALGSNVIILSDRNSNARMAPIPSLLLTAAVHEHLVREKSRTRVGLVVESGDAREVHHIALLIGYGASAVNPYLAFETIDDVIAHKNVLGRGVAPPGPDQLHQGGVQGRHQDHVQDGGVDRGVVHRSPDLRGRGPRSGDRGRVLHRHGQPHRWSGARRSRRRGRRRATASPISSAPASGRIASWKVGGEYQWRREGEIHLFNPKTVFKLQHATRAKRYDIFKEYTKLVDDQADPSGDAARPAPIPRGTAPRLVGGRGRARVRDREALRHRGDVLRIDLRRGARDPGHRHEPAGREVQHRRGGRGRGSASSPMRTATSGAAPSSRSPRPGSGSRASTW